MAAAKTEEFLPNHAQLPDDVLLALPDPLMTSCHMFVATVEAKITNVSITVNHLTETIEKVDPAGPILVINSNFGHKAQAGYERMLKLGRKKKRRLAGRERKMQGDGTCFNSTLEPNISLAGGNPDATPQERQKIYKLKCFMSTGQTQVPGTLRRDLSDGRAAVQAWVDFLNKHELGLPDDDGGVKTIGIEYVRPNMINFRFMLRRTSPRVLVNIRGIAQYLSVLAAARVSSESSAEERAEVTPRLPAGTALVAPPFRVCEVKPPNEDVKLAFMICFPRRKIRINIFQRAKINILGADSFESGEAIYAYLADLFTANWTEFVYLLPLRDSDRRQAPAPRVARPAPSLAGLGAVLDEILNDADFGEVDREDKEQDEKDALEDDAV
ncbi:MAG: hypothetical protein KGL39_10900 [Patescibacteria group bacterium]|nr:hypothetical protein [Patescibacteria group bacterium]